MLLLAACGDDPAQPVVVDALDLTAEWEAAEPASLGLDAQRLEDAAATAEAIPRMRSLVVVREGRMVLERYFHGFERDSLADVRSVTKSIVSILTGIALDHRNLQSVDQTVGELLPPELGTPSPTQASITLENLLTMSGGFQWDESGVTEYNNWRLSGDFIGYLLDRPIVNPPGSTFTYNSAAVHLLSVLVERSVGAPLELFADIGLFSQIGVGARRWEGMFDGTVNGGAGLDLKPRDLARVGQLMLQRGRSGDVQVLPEAWVDRTTSSVYGWSRQVGTVGSIGYGHLWWIDRDRGAYFAWGYGGQFLYVVPSRALVVVATTDWVLLSQDGGPGPLEAAVLEMIVHGVVPAAPLL